MANDRNIPVGKLGKPHGLSGAFRFFLERNLKNKKKLPAHLLLNISGSFMPWFIKNIEWTGFNEGYILFEEVSSPEKAKQYTGLELYLGEKDVSIYFIKNAQSIDYLDGYKVTDEADGELGIIDEVIENPGQILLSVKKDGREILIPFVDDFVVKVNKRKKEIVLSLPEGLVDSQL